MKQTKKNQKGFTLIELIIVIAIMGILAAVLVPSFTQMTTKAKVSADLRSIQTLQRQMEIYASEHGGKYPEEITTSPKATKLENAIYELVVGEYVENKLSTLKIDSTVAANVVEDDLTSTGGRNVEKVLGLQSGVPIVFENNKFKLDSTSTVDVNNKSQDTRVINILKNLAKGESTDKDLIK